MTEQHNIDFGCTKCGHCCRHFKLPLTVTEAISWLENGNDVQILCEAATWQKEPTELDPYAIYWKRSSFAAMSGTSATRVKVTLAAPLAGACIHLDVHMHCEIYHHRPLVCQIYPAEINPFIEFKIANKTCPPEAWTPGRLPLHRQGMIVDARLQYLIEQTHYANQVDAHTKERLCAHLQIDAAAIANEGFVVHSLERSSLLNALFHTHHETRPLDRLTTWRFLTDQHSTLAAITASGASGILVDKDFAAEFDYLNLRAATT